MKVAIWIHVASYREAVLDAIQGMSGLELVVTKRGEDVPAALDGADAFISSGASAYTPQIERALRENSTVRWFQSVSAGNDNLETLGIRDGIAVTGSQGHSGPVVAEHAIALLLAIAHAVPDWERGRIAKIWKIARTGTYKSLYGGSAVVVGLGHIGSEIATRLKGLGMTVLGVTRTRPTDAPVDEWAPAGDLAAVVAGADAVLLATPLTAATRHLINAETLAAFRPGAYLVNVARGGLIDQAALVDALRSGRLGGAALDVADPEPLLAQDPLWDAPNLILTPHVGGSGSTESPRRLAETVKRNLETFCAGRPFERLLPYGRP